VAVSGDGERHAVLAYSTATGGMAPGCRLALLDLEAGAVVRTQDVCGPGESVRDVALDEAAGVPVAYVALWGWPTPAPGGGVPGEVVSGRGRVVALAPETGTVLAAHATPGHPGRLLLGPERGSGGRRLYFVETSPPPPGHPESWRLVALDAATLAPEGVHPLPADPLWPAVAPDGEHLYALTGQGGSFSHSVVDVNLTTGAVSRLLALPGEGLGLVAGLEALYVLDPDGGALWVIDRRRGRLRRTTAHGRTPVTLALGPAG
jgi:hypothetical protein